MQPDSMIRYEFDETSGNIATDEETIIIGFATQEKKGMLMHIRNNDVLNPEYITVELNNNGETLYPHFNKTVVCKKILIFFLCRQVACVLRWTLEQGLSETK